jgi:hypothetical protein
VSQLCVHEHAQGPQSCGCRVLVKNCSKSAIAKKSGAVQYLRATPQQKRTMEEKAKHCCLYCQAPLFDLKSEVFFRSNFCWPDDIPDPPSDSEEEEASTEGFDICGDVCGNGHLTLGVYGNWWGVGFLDQKPIVGSGEMLKVLKTDLVEVLCEVFGAELHEVGDDSELKFRERLDAFSVSKRLRRLAGAIEEREVDDSRQGAGGDVQTEAQLREELKKIEQQLAISNDAEFNHIEESDSETDEETCADIQPEHRSAFWDVSRADVEIVKGLLEEVPDSERVIQQYIVDRKQSVSRTLVRIEELKALHRRRTLVQAALQKAKDQRKAEIEAAFAR